MKPTGTANLPPPGAPGPVLPGGKPRSYSLRVKLAALLTALLVAAGLAEIGLRLCFKRHLVMFQDERGLIYTYDKDLGWFPIPNHRDLLVASRPFHVFNNHEGFRAPEQAGTGKPEILFLGDSFVWGFDVEAEERFTDKLQARHPEWAVVNFGVSGYGTDQEYLLLQKKIGAYRPRVVFLLFCVETDHLDNCANARYGGYYKPYCTIEGTRLRLNGVPVPRGERVFFAEHDQLCKSYLVRMLARAYFRRVCPPIREYPDPTGAILRDLQKYVQSKGAVFLMGLTKKNPRLEEFLQYFKIPYVDLSTDLRYPDFCGHWTPEGHTFACDRIEQFLREGHYLDAAPAGGK